MRLKLTFFIFISFVYFNINAQVSESTPFGNGILNITGKDSTWAMKIGGRLEFLATSTWPENGDYESNFSIRRARLKFDGFVYSPKLRYDLQLAFSNSDMSGSSEFTGNSPRFILDAVVKWNFYNDFELWFGQAKLPGNRERLISSGAMQLVDRSLLDANFNIDRDLGIQLHHQFKISQKFIIREIVAISQGEGRNITTGNLGGYQYTGRLEALPFGKFENNGDYSGGDLSRESTPKLAIAATYDFNNKAVKTGSNQGKYMHNDVGFYETDISTVFVDAIFKYQGFSLMAEYADRTADDPFAKNSDNTLTSDVVKVGTALNLQTGYLFKSNWEISARYTNLNIDKTIVSKEIEDQYTLGVSKYIVNHKLKVQSDISYLDVANGNNQIMFRLQFDMQF